MNKPVAWINETNTVVVGKYPDDIVYSWKPLYTHPVKEQSNLVNVVKNHIEDLVRCVKLFRSYEMDNTADEMEVAIKELEDAIKAHPAELTDEEIMDEVFKAGLAVSKDTDVFLLEHDVEAFIEFAKAILRKAQEK